MGRLGEIKTAQLKHEVYIPIKHFHLPGNVTLRIKSTFRALSSAVLLEKCVQGKTQNINESLNNVIRIYVPKETRVMLKMFKFGVYEAVSTFGDGYTGKCKL